MSARVLNPSLLSDFCRMRSPVRSAARSACGPSPSRPVLNKVKRDLFGPVEKDEFKQFFDAEISKHQQRATERWGFNFARGHPLADHQQYAWERVPPTAATSAASQAPPAMYTLSHAAHTRSMAGAHHNVAAAAAAPFLRYDDLLLDERAHRHHFAAASRLLNDSTGSAATEGSEDDEDLLNSSADSATGANSRSSSGATPLSPRTAANIAQAASVAKTCRLSLVITATKRSSSTASGSMGRPTLRASTRQQRQPRITDYLKERKRLTATPKKVSPSKRTRLSASLGLVD